MNPTHAAARVFIPSQYSFPKNKRNMNAYQRIFYGSRYAHLTLFVRRKAVVSEELEHLVEVRRAPVQNRWLFLVFSVLFSIILRFRGYRLVLTEPSGFATVGFLARFLAGYRWVLDVWDRPRWRSGEHEEGAPRRLSDRLVFWVMRHADDYLLSVLPRAARDIDPDPSRCLQLYNAIDLSLVASEPPQRVPGESETLHVAYGRSKFWDTMGLDLLIHAAAKLKQLNCPFVVHLVGELPEAERRKVENSWAASCFRLHGFIQSAEVLELYRSVHVGIVPYPSCEDLSYIFPIKVLEHLSQGNPVIASRLPGLSAMVQHEENGLLIEPGSVDELATAIARLQQDIPLYNRLASTALRSIQRFDAQEKNRRIFETLLSL